MQLKNSFIKKAVNILKIFNPAAHSKQLFFRSSKAVLKSLSDYIITNAFAATNPETEEEILAIYNQGLILIKSGELQKALINFNKLLKMSPKFPNAAAIRNKIIERLDETESAASEPGEQNKAEIYFNEGNALYELGLFEEALAAYDKAASIDKNNPILWYYKANSLLKLNMIEQALETYEKVLAINPNFADAWHGKSSCLIRLHRTDEALACFDKILEIDPEHAPFIK